MKILYDHQAFILQKYGGISRYFANLYDHLNGTEFECNLSLLHSNNYYLGNKSYLPKQIGNVLLKRYKKIDKWNKYYTNSILQKDKFDVFHPTYYDPYFLTSLKKPFIITVHDMIHELYPEWFAGYDVYSNYKRLIFEKATHFIAISESTKNDLQSIYNVEDSKITVVHHGYDLSVTEAAEYIPPFSNYILYVGDRATYKNFNRFINAVTPILQRYPDISIICAGGGEFSIVEKELFIRKNLRKIIQISAEDSELKILYEKALVFVYPSLCEGFGIPILEAFANGCPSVVSNINCFMEVGGESCQYFDPYNIEEMSSQIEKVINSLSLSDQLREAGKVQLQKFSIKACIDKTAAVYKLIN